MEYKNLILAIIKPQLGWQCWILNKVISIQKVYSYFIYIKKFKSHKNIYIDYIIYFVKNIERQAYADYTIYLVKSYNTLTRQYGLPIY